jgi:hypothetical protein
MDRVAPVRFPGSASVSVSRCDTSGVWERVPAAQRRFCSATCSRTEQNGRRSFSERSRCAVHGQIHEGTESAGGPWMSLGVPGHGLCPLRHSQESRVDRVVAIPHLDEGLRSMAKVAVPVRLRPEAGCHCPATTCRIPGHHLEDHVAVDPGGAAGVMQQQEPSAVNGPQSGAKQQDRQPWREASPSGGEPRTVRGVTVGLPLRSPGRRGDGSRHRLSKGME